MINFVCNYYLWIKAFHVIAVICWMAGIFYLPRLMIYNIESSNDQSKQTLNIMAERLYRIIMKPAMHVSLALGILLLFIPGTLSMGWIHLKIFCVLCLIMLQFYLNHSRLKILKGTNQKSSRFFRILNEIPTLLLIIIIICVIVKPF